MLRSRWRRPSPPILRGISPRNRGAGAAVLLLVCLLTLIPLPEPARAQTGPPRPGPSRQHLPVLTSQTATPNRAGLLRGKRFVGVADDKVSLADLREIRDTGFDGIRYYVGQWLLEDYDRPRAYKAYGLSVLDSVLQTCQQLGLSVILDLHTVYGWDGEFYTDDELVSRWYDLWTFLAQRYKAVSRETLVAYELLNEPHNVGEARWTQLTNTLIQRLRPIDARPIVVSNPYYGSPEWFITQAVYPYPDIVYTVHFYHPWPFAMQGNKQTWHHCQDRQFSYPGTYDDCAGPAFQGYWDRRRLEDKLKAVFAFQQAGYEIFVGEWDYGWENTAPLPDALRWMRDMRAVFEAHGWAWAWHQWGGAGFREPDATLLRWTNNGAPTFEREKLAALGLSR